MALSLDTAWNALLARSRAQETLPALHFSDKHPRGWRSSEPVDASVEAFLDLYGPLVASPKEPLVVAHLGQSLDGRIATSGGVSQFITGDDNLVHTHRMRALFDAVIVGAQTALHDDPRLTTRLVSGEHATRVLIDPDCSIQSKGALFTDGSAKTVVVCARGTARSPVAHESYVEVEPQGEILPPASILAALRSLGLTRVFVEGGGITVSHFLAAGALHRVHVCIAPMILGSGRPSFTLPPIELLEDGLRPRVRHFTSGSDVLFDCELVEELTSD